MFYFSTAGKKGRLRERRLKKGFQIGMVEDLISSVIASADKGPVDVFGKLARVIASRSSSKVKKRNDWNAVAASKASIKRNPIGSKDASTRRWSQQSLRRSVIESERATLLSMDPNRLIEYNPRLKEYSPATRVAYAKFKSKTLGIINESSKEEAAAKKKSNVSLKNLVAAGSDPDMRKKIAQSEDKTKSGKSSTTTLDKGKVDSKSVAIVHPEESSVTTIITTPPTPSPTPASTSKAPSPLPTQSPTPAVASSPPTPASTSSPLVTQSPTSATPITPSTGPTLATPLVPTPAPSVVKSADPTTSVPTPIPTISATVTSSSMPATSPVPPPTSSIAAPQTTPSPTPGSLQPCPSPRPGERRSPSPRPSSRPTTLKEGWF